MQILYKVNIQVVDFQIIAILHAWPVWHDIILMTCRQRQDKQWQCKSA